MALRKEEKNGILLYITDSGNVIIDPINYSRFLEEKIVQAENDPLRNFLTTLIGLGSKPIQGRIMLIKEAFMFYQEKLRDLHSKPLIGFFPHRYGPFSRDIAIEIKAMARDGLVRVDEEGGVALTDLGKIAFRKITESYPGELKADLMNYRKGLDELGSDGIMRYVYENFIDYTLNSKVKSRYLKNGRTEHQ